MLLLSLVTAGCAAAGAPAPTTADATARAAAPPTDPPPPPVPPTPVPGPGSTPDAAPGTPPTPQAARCTQAQRGVMQTAVTAQLDAIVARDWAAALTHATPGFRESLDEDRFASVIVDEFPVVADAAGADTGECRVTPDGTVAQLVVTVVDGDGTEQELLYLLELHDDVWLIGGALPTQTTGDAGGSMEV